MAARAAGRSNFWLEQVCSLRGREAWRDRNDQFWAIAEGADSALAQKITDLSGYQDRSHNQHEGRRSRCRGGAAVMHAQLAMALPVWPTPVVRPMRTRSQTTCRKP